MTDIKEPGKPEIVQFGITGMTCSNCAMSVEKGLSGTPGVLRAAVNFASEKATVEYDPDTVDLSGLKDAVTESGYGVITVKTVFPIRGMT